MSLCLSISYIVFTITINIPIYRMAAGGYPRMGTTANIFFLENLYVSTL